jgi:hypothetical protein
MKNPTKHLLFAAFVCLLFCTACRKQALTENLSTPVVTDGFVQYTIPKGAHYANGNDYKPIDLTEQRFVVRFDSSCIYQTVSPENQGDINKLYGFADNGALHQQYSARFGWRWSDGALRLFAYTYNDSVRDAKELGTAPIGKDIHCSIKLTKGAYIFSMGENLVSMPRSSTTATAKGYRLYPYFGGDETAPHEVRIWIKEEK